MRREKILVFWFRRDLRLFDNTGLSQALEMCRKEKLGFYPLFIFDKNILNKLEPDDSRVQFIFQQVEKIKAELLQKKLFFNIHFDSPKNVFESLCLKYEIERVVANHDYEPGARKRDREIGVLAKAEGFSFVTFKDQVVFEKDEVLTDAGKPYTVFTPYKKKWLSQLTNQVLKEHNCDFGAISAVNGKLKNFSLNDLGFKPAKIIAPQAQFLQPVIKAYAETRNFPALETGTSHLGVHLRFGTVSIRELVKKSRGLSEVWLSELIWREFFMQILWHFPQVENTSYRPQYDQIEWRKSRADLEKWKKGQTGYPLVDAGMRELVATGTMHNRVRMVTASFLTKHLLIHWSEGERFFAEHLLDYDLAANNGNWQWAAGTGCDAAPYFRVFNPESQAQKFDPENKYIKKWVPELESSLYPEPMIDHKTARVRCLRAFKAGLEKK